MSLNTLVSKLTSTPQNIWKYMQESYAELRKVSWPSRQTTIQYTIIVAASSIMVGILIGGLDFLLTLAFEKIII